MENREDRIRRRAYEIWEREGRVGHPEDHWYRAERELAATAPEGSDATVEATSPAAAVRAVESVGDTPAAAQQSARKPRRKRTT
jgi:Protein of unknown function (DUF2934)